LLGLNIATGPCASPRYTPMQTLQLLCELELCVDGWFRVSWYRSRRR